MQKKHSLSHQLTA